MSKTKLPHFRELDGLRGVAATAIFFHHYLTFWMRRHPAPYHPELFSRFLLAWQYGAYGVDLFFVLSGFLITSLLFIEREGKHLFHNFYWKRVLRILPVYLVHLLVVGLFVPGAVGYVVLCLLFIENFANHFHVRDLGTAWTLSIEEQFYLFWPQVIRRLSLRTVYYLSFGLILLSNALRFAMVLKHGAPTGQVSSAFVIAQNLPFWHNVFERRETYFRCDGLAFGALLACQWFSDQDPGRFVRQVLAFVNSRTLLTVALAAICCLVTVFRDSPFQPASFLSVFTFCAYRLIRFVVTQRQIAGRRLSWLASPVAVYMGGISYALYLYHVNILAWADEHMAAIPETDYLGFFLRSLLLFAICIAACTASRYFLELPVQRLRRFILKPDEATKVGSVST